MTRRSGPVAIRSSSPPPSLRRELGYDKEPDDTVVWERTSYWSGVDLGGRPIWLERVRDRVPDEKAGGANAPRREETRR